MLAVRLGEALGLGEAELREVYYQALLRYIGCNAETHMLAAVVGDELALRTDFATVDNGNSCPKCSAHGCAISAQANAGASPLQLAQAIVRGLARSARSAHEFFGGHCEVAQRLAERLGFDARIDQRAGAALRALGRQGHPRR